MLVIANYRNATSMRISLKKINLPGYALGDFDGL